MALLNYSSQVPITTSVGEIQKRLASHHARSILTQYDDQGEITGIAFELSTPFGIRHYRIPVNVDGVLNVLTREHRAGKLSHGKRPDRAQAGRVAWRIMKDWVEAQLAIIDSAMVSVDEVFLPYMLTEGVDGPTVYQAMLTRHLELPPGSPPIALPERIG